MSGSVLSRPAGFRGEFHLEEALRGLYATDASAYEEMPRAVALPRDEADVAALLRWAAAEGLPLIPRAAGTSLAGQVVGDGVVVDFSRHFTRILEVDPVRRLARVQPGVIRNDLNQALRPHGLFFAPETATQSRAMLGGMYGNNSCGSNSVHYGTTRDHVLAVAGFLADGTRLGFGPRPADYAGENAVEEALYAQLRHCLGTEERRARLRAAFPDARIRRRNTGYALDCLLGMEPFGGSEPLNLARFLAGTEGTLFLATELTLVLEPLPPPHGALVCAHFASVADAIAANLTALAAAPFAVELIDDVILGCTTGHPGYAPLRFFVEGEPGGLLVIDLRDEDAARLEARVGALLAELRSQNHGYAHPVVRGRDQEKVWALRNAGLGLLANVPGRAKALPVIEDGAVAPADLPAYVREVDALAAGMGLRLVHYAHAGSGELHIRPIIDLSGEEGRRQFRAIAEGVVEILRRYRGSLSGEHGDGRLRSEFIEAMVGTEVYGWMREVKQTWDPDGRLNPGKIIDPVRMDTAFRRAPEASEVPPTVFDYSGDGGLGTMAARCNGSGDCRRSHLGGGTMCPSYMATRHEKDTTRARANSLRRVLAGGLGLADPQLDAAMELCLSCKACKTECPSRVDVAKMKAEYLQARHDRFGAPWRVRLVARFALWQRLAARLPWAWNLATGAPVLGSLTKALLGFAPERGLPRLPGRSLRAWWRGRGGNRGSGETGAVVFFGDEFTATTDTAIGVAAIELLEGLGYAVEWPEHPESGRVWLSQGYLRRARDLACEQLSLLGGRVSEERPLVGVEPSALLCFRDEYPELVSADRRPAARRLAANAFLLDEFLTREAEAGRVSSARFRPQARRVLVHGHCYQKALGSQEPTRRMLGLVEGHAVELIPSGCCGMAGAFGYWKSKYEVSMQVGELVLLPTVRAAEAETLIVAPGTSCRHQIHDGAGRRALHPAEVLRAALRD
jgi:FAD/FMN-containing dehydrogenase/Fe-S oxidoreductase